VSETVDVRTKRKVLRVSLILTLFVTVFGTLYTAWAIPAYYGSGWSIGIDPWVPMRAADSIARGDYVHIYSSVGGFVATPGLPILLAPIAWVGQRLHLTEGLGPLASKRPTEWLIYGPFGYLLTLLLFWGMGRLDRDIGAEIGRKDGRGSGYLVAQLSILALVFWPTSIVFAHFEEIVALAFTLFALRRLLQREYVAAAVMLGIAVAFKQWAALLIPLFIGWTPRGSRLKVIAWSVGIPGVLLVPPLLGDRQHAWNALLHAQVFPSLGRTALWVSASRPFAANGFRAGSLAFALIAGWWLRDRGSTRMVLAGSAVVLTARLLFEPVLFVPYLCAPLVLLVLHARARGRRGWLAIALGIVALLMFTSLRIPQWVFWPVEIALWIPLLWVAVGDFVRRRGPATEQPVAGADSGPAYSGQPV
jgi:hypothetical protein